MPVKHPLASRFTLAPTTATPRILAAPFGDIGSGKTFFLCTAPAPIVIQSFDRGTEGVVEQFREAGKEIYVKHYDWAPDETEDFQKRAEEIRDEFIADYEHAVRNARTVGWDKEGDIWNVVRYADFGSPKGDVPRDFDRVNQRMRRYLQLPKSLDVNFFAIQGAKEEWVSQNKKSGNLKRDGFRETAGLMHIELLHERIDGEFFTTVGKARGPNAADILDQRFPNLTVPELGMLLFPDTTEDFWI